jgi:hypothetical protein
MLHSGHLAGSEIASETSSGKTRHRGQTARKLHDRYEEQGARLRCYYSDKLRQVARGRQVGTV